MDPTAFVFDAVLPPATQRAIALTQAPAFAEAESAAARQFGTGGGVTGWISQNTNLIFIGAGTLLALALLGGRRR